MTSTDPRAMLRAVLVVRDAAAERVRAAAEAAGRARQLLAEAEANLAEFRAVEDRVSARHSGAVRAWASAGSGERPSLETPAALADARHQRADAEAHVSAIRDAYDGLATDLAAAEREAADAAAAVHPAVIAVQVGDMHRDLDRLDVVRAEAQRLRERTASLGMTLLDGPQRLIDSMRRDAAVPVFKSTEAGKAEWRAHAAALAHDPEAVMPGDPPASHAA